MKSYISVLFAVLFCFGCEKDPEAFEGPVLTKFVSYELGGSEYIQTFYIDGNKVSVDGPDFQIEDVSFSEAYSMDADKRNYEYDSNSSPFANVSLPAKYKITWHVSLILQVQVNCDNNPILEGSEFMFKNGLISKWVDEDGKLIAEYFYQ